MLACLSCHTICHSIPVVTLCEANCVRKVYDCLPTWSPQCHFPTGKSAGRCCGQLQECSHLNPCTRSDHLPKWQEVASLKGHLQVQNFFLCQSVSYMYFDLRSSGPLLCSHLSFCLPAPGLILPEEVIKLSRSDPRMNISLFLWIQELVHLLSSWLLLTACLVYWCASLAWVVYHLVTFHNMKEVSPVGDWPG